MINLFSNDISSLIKKQIERKKGNSRRRSLYDYFNLDIFGNLPTIGTEQMPILQPLDSNINLPNRLMEFSLAYTKQCTDCIIHFFTDDRRFLRLIRNPEKYLPFLRKCPAVIEPDLSQFADMPYPMRQAHAWLNRAIAAWLQTKGVNIIQNITWSLRDSYGYSLTGRAKNTVIAVNSTGILKHDFSQYLWKEGYKNVVLPLKPTKILRYGDKMPNEMTDISVYFENPNFRNLRYGR